MKNYSVHQLRQNKYKVRVIHERYYFILSTNPASPGPDIALLPRRDADRLVGEGIQLFVLPKGGVTKVEITTPSGNNIAGEAQCSIKDSFNRKLGLTIALNRAMAGSTEVRPA